MIGGEGRGVEGNKSLLQTHFIVSDRAKRLATLGFYSEIEILLLSYVLRNPKTVASYFSKRRQETGIDFRTEQISIMNTIDLRIDSPKIPQRFLELCFCFLTEFSAVRSPQKRFRTQKNFFF